MAKDVDADQDRQLKRLLEEGIPVEVSKALTEQAKEWLVEKLPTLPDYEAGNYKRVLVVARTESDAVGFQQEKGANISEDLYVSLFGHTQLSDNFLFVDRSDSTSVAIGDISDVNASGDEAAESGADTKYAPEDVYLVRIKFLHELRSGVKPPELDMSILVRVVNGAKQDVKDANKFSTRLVFEKDSIANTLINGRGEGKWVPAQ